MRFSTIKTSLRAATPIFVGLCIWTWCCCPGILFANEKIIHAIGSSQARPDRPEKAREEAVMNSLIQAVNQVIVELTPEEKLIRSFSEINETIYPDIRNFIQNYKVLTEYKSDTEYRVLVQADISVKLLSKLLPLDKNGLDDQGTLPKILLLISEQYLESKSPVFWWNTTTDQSDSQDAVTNIAEHEIARALSERGFPVIRSINPPSETENRFQMPQTPDIPVSQAIQIGRLMEAGVVVMGKSAAHRTLNSMNENTRTYSGVVTLRAYSTDTEHEIGFSIQNDIKINEDPAEGVREALSVAGSRAADEIVSNIEEYWMKHTSEKAILELVVGGNAYLRNFVKFREKLEEIPDVKDINLSEMKSDEATLIVNYKGSGREFAEYLMLTTFENFGLNIYEVSDRHLRIELINK